MQSMESVHKLLLVYPNPPVSLHSCAIYHRVQNVYNVISPAHLLLRHENATVSFAQKFTRKPWDHTSKECLMVSLARFLIAFHQPQWHDNRTMQYIEDASTFSDITISNAFMICNLWRQKFNVGICLNRFSRIPISNDDTYVGMLSSQTLANLCACCLQSCGTVICQPCLLNTRMRREKAHQFMMNITDKEAMLATAWKDVGKSSTSELLILFNFVISLNVCRITKSQFMWSIMKFWHCLRTFRPLRRWKSLL